MPPVPRKGAVTRPSDPFLDALVEEWTVTLTSPHTAKVYAERARAWLVWCEQRRIEPLEATWIHIDHHLHGGQYAGDPLRRSAIRRFYKWLTATGRIETDPSLAPPQKVGCLRDGCETARYGSQFCRGHHLAAGGTTGPDRTCRECGNTKLATEFLPRELLCKQCRSIVRKRKRANRIAAGEVKRCTRCLVDKPLDEFRTENSFCRSCKSASNAQWGSAFGGALRTAACEHCGTAFTRSRSEGAGRFCSRECTAEGSRRYPKHPCGWCGRPVTRTAQNTYCSKRCAGLARRDPDALITCECRTCGSIFTRHRSRVEWGRGRHCSRECQLRGRNSTACEEVLYDLLDELIGPEGWIPQHRVFPNRRWVPDAVIHSQRLILQADGDYWHGKDPSTHANPIIAGRVKADAEFNAYAADTGWTVLRLWEFDLMNNPDNCRERIRRALQ
jgi:very-short-patch-repair endonuclease